MGARGDPARAGRTETAKGAAAAGEFRPRSAPVVAASCLCEWLLPGLGYLALGRRGRAIGALATVGFLFAWGIALGGELSRPQPGQILSYLKTFACLGLGAAYPAGLHARSIGSGAGDLTRASHEYGNTFVLAGGLIAYLLVLDVFDIAVGRKA